LKRRPILRRRRCVGRPSADRYPSFEGGASAGDIVSTGEDENEGWLVAGGVPYSVARKTGKAAMVGKIEGLGGNLGGIAWIDEAGLA
jgi:hypothetical protein